MLKHLFSFARQSWYKVNLLDYATLDFPGNPQLNTSGNGLTEIRYSDEINFYVVDIEELSNYGLDVRPSELNDLYNRIIVGFFQNPQNRALVKKKYKVGDLIGLEIIYSVQANDVPNLRYKRLLFYNDKIFSYEFWTTLSNEEKSKNMRDKYFDSFAITLAKSILRQYTIE